MFRKLINQLHLWLGLVSGIVVFIVSITGCLYVFNEEIYALFRDQSFDNISQQQPMVPPSTLLKTAKICFPDRVPNVVVYREGHNARVKYFFDDHNNTLFVNPYNGRLVRKVDSRDSDQSLDAFFAFIIRGHRYLWLPFKIGQYVVGGAILLFILSLLTGLVLWWPKSRKKKAVKEAFAVKWKARFKRLNHDLHNVLGFYVLLIALILAITGIWYTFQWAPKAVYWIASGGQQKPSWTKVVSDTTAMNSIVLTTALDTLWYRMWQPHSTQELYMNVPQKEEDTYFIRANAKPGTIYQQEIYYYDRYSLKEVHGGGIYSQSRDATASVAQKIDRMAYDIHIGSIGGLFTKIIACMGSLVCASLPVTGAIIWLGKKKKKRKRTQQSPIQKIMT